MASLTACPAGGQVGVGWALYSPPLGLPESKGVCVSVCVSVRVYMFM